MGCGGVVAARTGDRMTETRNENITEPRFEPANGHPNGFLKGLFGGALLGAAAGVLFAPQLYAAFRNLRRQLTDVTADATDAATERYRDTAAAVGEAVDDLQRKGRGLYGKALSVVVRGADEVQERATKAQTDLEQREANATRRSS
jgi:gas vesicle protein